MQAPGQVQQRLGKVPKVPEKVCEALVQSQVRFNRVPEKVPKVPEKVWEALVSQVRFNRVPEKVPEVPEKVWEALVQSQVRFNRFPEKVPRSAKPSQVQQGSGEGSGEGRGGFGFGAEPGHVQQGSGEGSTGFRRRFLEGLGGFGAEPGQVQQDLRPFEHASKRFVKIKRRGCWGYHRSLFWNGMVVISTPLGEGDFIARPWGL